MGSVCYGKCPNGLSAWIIPFPNCEFLDMSLIRQWLLSLEVEQPWIAHGICQFIPAQCPFARDLNVLGWEVHIPPLCHLNPFFNEVMELRCRALNYLANERGEDVAKYCH
jgi:hypothetical protein